MMRVGGAGDLQMIADWQMQVISARTNMLEEICFSSRLAYRDRFVQKRNNLVVILKKILTSLFLYTGQ